MVRPGPDEPFKSSTMGEMATDYSHPILVVGDRFVNEALAAFSAEWFTATSGYAEYIAIDDGSPCDVATLVRQRLLDAYNGLEVMPLAIIISFYGFDASTCLNGAAASSQLFYDSYSTAMTKIANAANFVNVPVGWITAPPHPLTDTIWSTIGYQDWETDETIGTYAAPTPDDWYNTSPYGGSQVDVVASGGTIGGFASGDEGIVVNKIFSIPIDPATMNGDLRQVVLLADLPTTEPASNTSIAASFTTEYAADPNYEGEMSVDVSPNGLNWDLDITTPGGTTSVLSNVTWPEVRNMLHNTILYLELDTAGNLDYGAFSAGGLLFSDTASYPGATDIFGTRILLNGESFRATTWEAFENVPATPTLDDALKAIATDLGWTIIDGGAEVADGGGLWTASLPCLGDETLAEGCGASTPGEVDVRSLDEIGFGFVGTVGDSYSSGARRWVEFAVPEIQALANEQGPCESWAETFPGCLPFYTESDATWKAAVVGDSIIHDATSDIYDEFADMLLTVRGIDGINLSDGLRRLVDIAVSAEPDTLIIELGVNSVLFQDWDATTQDDVQAILETVQDVACVIWITVTCREPCYYDFLGPGTMHDRIDTFNTNLAIEAASYPNVTIADFGAEQDLHPEYFTAAGDANPATFVDDGLHMNTTGDAALAAFMRSQVDSACIDAIYTYTGSTQNYVVPLGVTSLRITAVGAQGGPSTGGGTGGLGAQVSTVLAVTPTEVLEVNVGGVGAVTLGGWNGGGDGGTGYAGGGGGASDVRQGGSTLADRVITAAGGGGASHVGVDPRDGGSAGSTGTDGSGTDPGTGATPLAAGTGGSNATNGALGTGGNGSNLASGSAYGGGGGGGLYGGGGGGAVPALPNRRSGGGGGSSGATGGSTVIADAINSGDGYVLISL